MNSIYFDAHIGDDARRERLFNGDLFVYSATPSARALCELGRRMAEEAFSPLDPRTAQDHMPVETFAAVLADLKPKFIHHPDAKTLIPGMLSELGCNPEKVYFDVPRMRTATHGGYLTSGLAYAFHPHRDTWYSAPLCQLNWWLPIYDITPENGVAFHPRYWSQPVRNGSSEYNYYEWNKVNRKTAAQHIKTDTRKQPHPEEPLELEPNLRPICNVGGVVIFSAAQMHSTVPNTSGYTRFSIDFRTVHLDDVAARRGAPNVDSAATGTTLRDYLRASDLSHIPAELVDLYDDDSARRSEGELVFQPTVSPQPAIGGDGEVRS
jgi:hypothetical protein